jgi:flagellar FliL protein
LVFAVLNIAAIGAGLFFAFKATLGWQPPMITEDELRERMKQIETAHEAAAAGGGGGHGAAPAAGAHGAPAAEHGGGGHGASQDTFVYTMDPVTVNLGGDAKRMIKIVVNLAMLGEDGFEEIMDPEVKVKARDKIIRILNEKTFDDLETIQGKLFLKDEIIKSINATLHRGIVKDLYYSDFVIQSNN